VVGGQPTLLDYNATLPDGSPPIVGGGIYDIKFDAAIAVPEPSGLLLVSLGIASISICAIMLRGGTRDGS
jgi:hypothetical protein